MNNIVTVAGTAVEFVLVIAVVYALPVWILWNWIAVTLFAFPSVTLFQAFGLNLLCGMLFKGGGSK